MNTLVARAAAAASALVLASSLAASAADAPAPMVALTSPTTAPIRINDVWVHHARQNGLDPGIIAVSYTNTAPVTATKISFNVLGFRGRLIDAIDDAGSFSSGTTIHHEFPAYQIDNGQKLEVEEVDFADGSVWTKPVQAPVVRRQAAF